MKFLYLLVIVILLDLFFVPEDVSGWLFGGSRRRRRRQIPICRAPSLSGVAYNNKWNKHMKFTCPNGKSMNYIHSKYSHCHGDRVFAFSCANNTASRNIARCTWTHNYVNDFDEPMIFTCPNHGFITGVESYHSNTHNDRRFKFRCCHSIHFIHYHCKSSGWVNNWNSAFTWNVPRKYNLAGIISFHRNDKKDRKWYFTYCRPTCYRW